MKTSDVIALLRTLPDLTALVDQKIYNARVPTKDAKTGEVDVPFVWIKLRNDLTWGLQNPLPGDPPMGRVWDVECVADSMDMAESVRDAVYAVHGFRGSAGSANFVQVTIEDQSDDYIVRSAPDDAGLFVCALLFQAIGD